MSSIYSQQMSTDAPDLSWRVLCLSFAALVVFHFIVFQSTFADVVNIWWRSETFAHGFLVLPVVLWFVWKKRTELSFVPVTPDWRAIPVIVMLGLGWLLAKFISIAVAEHFFFFAFIPVLVWLIFGLAILRVIAFPLLFLLFAVPMGDELVPLLIDITADMAVYGLQITGIPVYIEGNLISIPTGNWSVVEACSGIRYLIASACLGVMYAYLMYQSTTKRTIFIVISLILPVIANGVRAYIIIMIGHLSGMKLAVGVDHLLYGWVFFGVVIFILFWAGSYWRDDVEEQKLKAVNMFKGQPKQLKVYFGSAVLLILVFFSAEKMLAYSGDVENIPLVEPIAENGWQQIGAEHSLTWRPTYLAADNELDVSYRDQLGNTVVLNTYLYRTQAEGKELISWGNYIVSSEDDVWKKVDEQLLSVSYKGENIPVYQVKIRSKQQEVLVWRALWIEGVFVKGKLDAKLAELKSRLTGARPRAAAIVVAAEVVTDREKTETFVSSFFETHINGIESALMTEASGNE